MASSLWTDDIEGLDRLLMLKVAVASDLLAKWGSMCKCYFEPDSPVKMESEMVIVSM